MSKESATSRIPRTNGVSRIPMPSSIRATNPTQLKSRPTQITAPLVKRPQPPQQTGLRPPTLVGHPLKKSSSRERINNVVNMVSKKSTTVLKKFFGTKPENATKSPQVALEHKDITNNAISTPPPLLRWDTYVCEDSPDDLTGGTHCTFVHSTPAVTSATSQMLGHNGTRHMFTTTQFPSKNSPCFGDTIILDSNSPLQRTHTVETMPTDGKEKEQLGNTVCLNTPSNGNLINLTKTLIETPMLGKTMLVNRVPEYLPRQMECIMNQISLHKAGAGTNTTLDSPVTNATYSNPGSIENMLMLEDVSVPSCFDLDITLQSNKFSDHSSDNEAEGYFPHSQAPDKSHMKLVLNSTRNEEHIIDLTKDTDSPGKNYLELALNSTGKEERIIDLTNEVDSPSLLINFTQDHIAHHANNTQLLYNTQLSCSATNTPDSNSKFLSSKFMSGTGNLMSPFLMKGAQSDLVLPTRTPDENLMGEPMDVDTTLTSIGARTEEFLAEKRSEGVAMSLQDINNPYMKQKTRFSFGLDLTESTLDCSIELVDASLSSAAHSQPNPSSALGNSTSLSASTQQLQQQFLKKQNSFELDESLGILTPDQMKEFLDSTHTNTNNLELPLLLHANANNSKANFHQMRVDQTPSPEELPLDPVEVKTDISDMGLAQPHHSIPPLTAQQHHQYLQSSCNSVEPVSLHTDTEHSKTEQMTKSNVSRISTSFITSVTSVTSLDTGYQGDGEMSRPASRGACDHSPSNGPAVRKVGGHVSRQPSFNQPLPPLPPIRRQDPMTDSDFFTESDADDIFHRGDRRAQVIDGQLYGPMLQQPTASVFITEDPQLEYSCMESSGIFTDVENRCDEDLAQMRRQDTQDAINDMSPDAEDSTETVKSNRDAKGKNNRVLENPNVESSDGQSKVTCSQTSSTIHSSLSTDRLSAATTLSNRTSYCSVDGNSTSNGESKSFASLETAFKDYAASAGDDGSPNVNTNMKRRTKSTTPGNTTLRYNDHTPAVPRVSSPRKHASLTSLCNGTSGVYHGTRSEAYTPPSGAKTDATAGSITRSTESCAGSGSAGAPTIKSVTKYTPRSLKTTQKCAKSKSSPVIVRKPLTPNKWDAVMNKIASNKALMKKNYNDVKSRVSTRGSAVINTVRGAGGGGSAGTGSPSTSPSVTASPISRRSPPSVSAGPASPTIGRVLNPKKSASPKDNVSNGLRLQFSEKAGLLHALNRGGSYSKDSQKSSQSDLSLTSGSPKLLLKTPLRAAKKRDVRNLSISPTDLGPPPKTTQTANGTQTRTKSAVVTITQKRFGTNAASPPPKEASPPKKISFTPKRLDISTKAPAKTPLKEQNRIIGSTQASNKSTSKNATSKAEPQTELQEISGEMHHNNNNITIAAAQADKAAAPATSLRTNSGTSSPLIDGHHVKKTAANPTVASSSLEKKAQAKVKSARKLPLHQQQQHSSFEAAAPATQSAEYLDAAELKQLKLLNRHSCNGRLDYESLEKHLEKAEELKAQQSHQDKTVEALGVMLQYLAYDMDAFNCPAAKLETSKSKDQLLKAMQQLDEAKTAHAELQDQLHEKEAYYSHREEELQALHRCELEKSQIKRSEYEIQANAKIAQLELKLTQQHAENKQAQNDYRLEMERKLAQKTRELAEAEERAKSLESRLQSLTEANQALHEKMISSEHTHAERLQSAIEREQNLNARVKALNAELDTLREKKETRERELRDKLNLTQEEVSVLRSSLSSSMDRSSMDRSSLSGTGSPRNSNSANAQELTRLHSEAESLRYVLELKQKEIFKLKRENEELLRDASERAALQGKISLLESKHEMLQSELEIKSEKEKELERKLEDVRKSLSHENTKRTRLSHDNEALQWQLKQRSEQLHLVEGKLQELSGHESFGSQHSNSYLTPTNRSSQLSGCSLRNYQMEDISPPGSPDVKSVIEKPHAVSWVLEIDDDTPETAALKMVKRAGSFRTVERSPSIRRSQPVGGANGVNGSAGPNPLSQSMSAASVIRPHSSEAAVDVPNRLQERTRSQSVCIKVPESTSKGSKKLAGSSRKHELASPAAWKEPILMCSSPYQHMRARTSTMKSGKADPNQFQDEMSLFTRSKKLITCDTSSLNSGERLEMGALPSQTHDLKLMKKCQQIQESAGEAMVSGTNSEDEGCSASSDDIVSSGSASTGTTGSNSSLNNLKNSHMSLDEALLIERTENPSGTPMEVSWCEDGDGALITNASV